MPKPPPPMKTIRLQRDLDPKADEPLLWDIYEEAKDKGMIATWNPEVEKPEEPMEPINVDAPIGLGLPVPQDGLGPSLGGIFGDSLDDAEAIARRLEEKYGDKPKKKITKRKPVELYDLEDEFIDDSELNIDAPTHIGKPVKEGFFVHSGPLELQEEVAPKPRPRTTGTGARRPKSQTAGQPSSSDPQPSLSSLVRSKHPIWQPVGEGTQGSPIQLDSDLEDSVPGPSTSPKKRKVPITVPYTPVDSDSRLFQNLSRDPRHLPPWPTFPDEVRARLAELRNMTLAREWNLASKNKFPDELRPPLRRVGEAAYHHDLFGSREDSPGFYASLTCCLPYNTFTLTKLVTKLCYNGYWDWLRECEDAGIELMSEVLAKIIPERVKAYDDAYAAWQEAVKAYDAQHPSSEEPNGHATTAPADQPASTTIDAPIEVNDDDEQPTANGDGRPKEPVKRFTWTQEIRDILAQLSDNMNEMNELNKRAREWKISGSHAEDKDFSERALRDRLYKRISEVFPDGYTNNTQISRESKSKSSSV
ncbi:hypothetical protein BCR39DRAFT_513729 [Naematelia encephala]|uniref:Ubinuclein middle domain-containing protein n=1 Tax=Naematelia encephala TaxID=71784 RepID=A0A1Y2BJ83_9TREE|nr:hypothetical protein BCR39DRAFT_513729 [Naematelia encephala]